MNVVRHLSIPLRVLLLAILALEAWIAAVGGTGVIALPYGVVGTVLTIRQPANRVGWLLVFIGLAFSLALFPTPPAWDAAGLTQYRLVGLTPEWTAWLSTAGVFPTFGAMFLLAVTFPTGRLPARPWRYGVIAVVALTLGYEAILFLMDGPIPVTGSGGLQEFDNPLGFIPGHPLLLELRSESGAGQVLGAQVVALGAAAVSMIVRLRRASGVERAQLLWVVASLVLLAAALVGVVLVTTAGSGSEEIWFLAMVAYPLPAIAVGIAILRYRLYEIDRLVNRAVVYGTVTAVLAGVFAGAITLSQRVLVAASGEGSDIAVVVTTLIVAAAYAPVRKRVESTVDRYLKYDERRFGPYRDELGKLLGLVDRGRAAARLAKEAQAELGARGVAVVGSGHPGGAEIVLATAGTWPIEVAARVPVDGAHAGLSAVLLGPPRRGGTYPEATLGALREVAAMAARATDGRPPAASA